MRVDPASTYCTRPFPTIGSTLQKAISEELTYNNETASNRQYSMSRLPLNGASTHHTWTPEPVAVTWDCLGDDGFRGQVIHSPTHHVSTLTPRSLMVCDKNPGARGSSGCLMALVEASLDVPVLRLGGMYSHLAHPIRARGLPASCKPEIRLAVEVKDHSPTDMVWRH